MVPFIIQEFVANYEQCLVFQVFSWLAFCAVIVVDVISTVSFYKYHLDSVKTFSKTFLNKNYFDKSAIVAKQSILICSIAIVSIIFLLTAFFQVPFNHSNTLNFMALYFVHLIISAVVMLSRLKLKMDLDKLLSLRKALLQKLRRKSRCPFRPPPTPTEAIFFTT
jgi:hypothetical protein